MPIPSSRAGTPDIAAHTLIVMPETGGSRSDDNVGASLAGDPSREDRENEHRATWDDDGVRIGATAGCFGAAGFLAPVPRLEKRFVHSLVRVLWFYATDPRSVASSYSVRANEVDERSFSMSTGACFASRVTRLPYSHRPRACTDCWVHRFCTQWIIIVTSTAELARSPHHVSRRAALLPPLLPPQPSSAAPAAAAWQARGCARAVGILCLVQP